MAVSGYGKPRAFIWNFCFGLIFGGCITYTLVKFSGIERYLSNVHSNREKLMSVNSDVFRQGGHIVVDDSNRVLESELKHFEQHHEHDFLGQDTLAKILYNKVRVLCWVMTGPQNIDKKAVHIYATWGKRCNKIIFISSEPSDKVPIVQVDTQEGRQYLWQKTRAAFQYIYENMLDDYEWFLKADDDTFVIVENLRYFLSSYDPDSPIYFGHKFKPYVKQGYMSGGGGYVASRNGVKRLIETAFSDSSKCKGKGYVGGAEDVEIGRCFEIAGVPAGDSRDSQERNRFHPFQPEAHLNPDGLPAKFWYWSYIFYPPHEGFEGCCSDYSVTFHYIPPAALYNLEYLVYHLRPFGLGVYPCPVDLPKGILQEAFAQQLQQGEPKEHETEEQPQGKEQPEVERQQPQEHDHPDVQQQQEPRGEEREQGNVAEEAQLEPKQVDRGDTAAAAAAAEKSIPKEPPAAAEKPKVVPDIASNSLKKDPAPPGDAAAAHPGETVR